MTVIALRQRNRQEWNSDSAAAGFATGCNCASSGAMAKALDLDTIAEGVETLAQGDRLVELGCTRAQGFYFSRPVAADQIPDTLRRLSRTRRPLVDAG